MASAPQTEVVLAEVVPAEVPHTVIGTRAIIYRTAQPPGVGDRRRFSGDPHANPQLLSVTQQSRVIPVASASIDP